MMSDVETSLPVSLDLSSVVEEAVRSAVFSVLTEIQRLIARNVAELRAAVAKKDCENEKLKAQLESVRRELREQARLNNKSNPSCCSDTARHHDTRGASERHESGSEPVPERGSPSCSQQWHRVHEQTLGGPLDSLDGGYCMQPETEPDMIPEAMMPEPPLFRHQGEEGDPRHVSTAMELKVVQVKEEVSAAQQTSPALDTDQSKPYICGECGKSYLWLKNLKKHQKIHTGEAPFSCNICCKHFSSQQVFEEHQRVHTGDRPHRCTYCSKTFNHLSNLKKHQLIHTGEKPHHCSLCGKRFRQIQHLKEHRKTHEDSKPFRCGECGWGFNHGSNFKRHLLVHTRQKMRHGLTIS
ncbi:zinc finger protein 286A-like [Scleropages formosus]|uniref:zinc finger protein 286A-like n=1 Tax=Scleropages formosus TaxID=113540 RepID=UPI0010FA94D9|nr:zinc finger protein 286A-like [Scleropages formosus]